VSWADLRPSVINSRHRVWRGVARVPWLLLGVLAVQTTLSIRLVWSNTAFTDEALYLWAGHTEWADLLHGTPVPAFATYFSGSPVVYPPVGALADSVGGLAGARLLSLAFMLGVTTLLWDAARHLFTERAAVVSAALFAVLGPTIKLGAFATYDAMALLLLAAAAWCVVRAGANQAATGWAAASGILLLASDLVKYATALFVPVVIALTYLVARMHCDRKTASMRAATVVLCWMSGIICCWELASAGNGYYATGIANTTLARAASTTSVGTVVHDSQSWIGLVVAIAAAGAVIAWSVRSASALLVTLLAGASVLVPLEQARIHTLTSLNKHADFGAWFAAIAAGYAVDWAITQIKVSWFRAAATTACALCLVLPARIGMAQARGLFAWPDTRPVIATLRSQLRGVHGNVLIDSHSVAEYYLRPPATEWRFWSSTSSLVLPSGRTISAPPGLDNNSASYEKLIRQGYFQLIELNTSGGLSGKLTAMLKGQPSEVMVAAVRSGPGSFTIWKYDSVRRAR